MKQWKSDWNIAGYTQRRRNYLDWKGIKEHERDYVLEDQDGYPLDEFLNKRAEKEKPYVRPLTNLRFKGHIIRRIVDNKDEWNAASIPERQAILKEIMRTIPGSERVINYYNLLSNPCNWIGENKFLKNIFLKLFIDKKIYTKFKTFIYKHLLIKNAKFKLNYILY